MPCPTGSQCLQGYPAFSDRLLVYASAPRYSTGAKSVPMILFSFVGVGVLVGCACCNSYIYACNEPRLPFLAGLFSIAQGSVCGNLWVQRDIWLIYPRPGSGRKGSNYCWPWRMKSGVSARILLEEYSVNVFDLTTYNRGSHLPSSSLCCLLYRQCCVVSRWLEVAFVSILKSKADSGACRITIDYSLKGSLE